MILKVFKTEQNGSFIGCVQNPSQNLKDPSCFHWKDCARQWSSITRDNDCRRSRTLNCIYQRKGVNERRRRELGPRGPATLVDELKPHTPSSAWTGKWYARKNSFALQATREFEPSPRAFLKTMSQAFLFVRKGEWWSRRGGSPVRSCTCKRGFPKGPSESVHRGASSILEGLISTLSLEIGGASRPSVSEPCVIGHGRTLPWGFVVTLAEHSKCGHPIDSCSPACDGMKCPERHGSILTAYR